MSFRFQPILNLRKHHEDQCRMRFKEEQTKLWRIDEELARLKEIKKQREAETEQLSIGVLNLEHLLSGSRYLAYLRRKQEETTAQRCVRWKRLSGPVPFCASAARNKSHGKIEEKMAQAETEERLRQEQKIWMRSQLPDLS